MNTRTPCVGICSTTYGDLVCRGCKRFAHEVVEWNGFDADQRVVIWGRLHELREGAVGQWLRVCDHRALMQRAQFVEVPNREGLSPLGLAYQVLRTIHVPLTELAEIGIQVRGEVGQERSTRDLLRQIDQEFYARSVAHYERNFKISAQ